MRGSLPGRLAAELFVQEFRRAYPAGGLDEADPAVSDLVGLLRIGQKQEIFAPIFAPNPPGQLRTKNEQRKRDGEQAQANKG